MIVNVSSEIAIDTVAPDTGVPLFVTAAWMTTPSP
jgi:hypothetical protein